MLKGLIRFNRKGVENNGSVRMEIKYKNSLNQFITCDQIQELEEYVKVYFEFGVIQKEEIYAGGVVCIVRYTAEDNQTDDDILELVISMYEPVEDADFVVDVVRFESWNGYTIEKSTRYFYILSIKFKRLKTKELINRQGQVIYSQSFNPETNEIILQDTEDCIYPRSIKVFYNDSNEPLCYLYYKEDHSFDYASIPEHHEENIDSGTEENLLRLQNTVGIPEEWMAYYSTAVFYPEHSINTI